MDLPKIITDTIKLPLNIDFGLAAEGASVQSMVPQITKYRLHRADPLAIDRSLQYRIQLAFHLILVVKVSGSCGSPPLKIAKALSWQWKMRHSPILAIIEANTAIQTDRRQIFSPIEGVRSAQE